MKKIENIIVSDVAYNDTDVYEIIGSNIFVVNLLLQEGADEEQLSKDALASYYVDYYLAQYNNGGFSQFVWNSGWDTELNELIEYGLQQMSAKLHIELFKEQCAKVKNLNPAELNAFLDNEYFGPNPTRDKLKNAQFYEIDKEENLIELNAKWLKTHPKLLVLSVDKIYDMVEEIL
nr:DUF4375 domain-containing protein [uncultured Flavobacterium sp.]